MELSLTFFVCSLLMQIVPSHQQHCLNDPGCKSCAVIWLNLPSGTISLQMCDKCKEFHQFSTTKNMCVCQTGYYLSNTTLSTCQICDYVCYTCRDSNKYCTSCQQGSNRIVNNAGQCECIDGFQQKFGLCVKKVNIVMIACSTVGCVVFFLIILFVLWKYSVNRSQSIQIHDLSAANNIVGNGQRLDMFIEDLQYDNKETPAELLWNTKQYVYKKDQVCSICLETETYSMTDCGHYFHENCIDSWLNNKSQCPNCTKKLDGRSIKVWCKKCKACLLPSLRNFIYKRRKSGKLEISNKSMVSGMICSSCQKVSNDTPAQTTI